MIGAAVTLLLVNQLVGPPENRTAWSEYESKIQHLDLPEMTAESIAAARRAEFERRFQAVVDAMNRFAQKYNESRGQIWPHKEAAEVGRAFRLLEKVAGSFDHGRDAR